MKTKPRTSAEPISPEVTEEGQVQTPLSTTATPYTSWVKQIVESLLDSEQKWLELAAEQNELTLKALKQGADFLRTTPTPPISEWARQRMETFMQTQRKWIDTASRQRDQLIQKAQESGKEVEGTPTPNAKTVADFARQRLEDLVEARNRWLDFVAKQNDLFIRSMEEIFGVKESSTAADRAKLAEETVDNYIELQKRWLKIATPPTVAKSEAQEAEAEVKLAN